MTTEQTAAELLDRLHSFKQDDGVLGEIWHSLEGLWNDHNRLNLEIKKLKTPLQNLVDNYNGESGADCIRIIRRTLAE